MTEAEPPPGDDLAQVVLRDPLAGALTALAACGAGLASLWLCSPREDQALVGAPGAALAFALGLGVGAGAALAAGELVWSLASRWRWPPRLLGVTAALSLDGAIAPLLGAFELLLVLTGSSAQAWGGLSAELEQRGPGLGGELVVAASLATATGLPLLLARRAHLRLLWQAALTALGAVAWLAMSVWLVAPLPVVAPLSVVSALRAGLAAAGAAGAELP